MFRKLFRYFVIQRSNEIAEYPIRFGFPLKVNWQCLIRVSKRLTAQIKMIHWVAEYVLYTKIKVSTASYDLLNYVTIQNSKVFKITVVGIQRTLIFVPILNTYFVHIKLF